MSLEKQNFFFPIPESLNVCGRTSSTESPVSDYRYVSGILTPNKFHDNRREPKPKILFCDHLDNFKQFFRYYLADGVRFCAQSTWLDVFKDQGRRMVARHLQDTVEYYTSAAQQVEDRINFKEQHCEPTDIH